MRPPAPRRHHNQEGSRPEPYWLDVGGSLSERKAHCPRTVTSRLGCQARQRRLLGSKRMLVRGVGLDLAERICQSYDLVDESIGFLPFGEKHALDHPTVGTSVS